MKERIAACFGAAGETYAAAATVQTATAQCVAERVPAGRYANVLEVGCGQGALTRPLLARIGHSRYLALDIAQGMLRTPEMAEVAATPGVVRVLADGEAAPLAPHSVDLVASASALQWFLTPERSIPALLRLLRPRGAFSLALFIEGTLKELAAASALSGFGSIFPLRSEAFYRELLASLPGVRFEAEVAERVEWFDSPRDVIMHLRRIGASHTPAKRPASATGYREFCRIYAERYGQGGHVPATYTILYLSGSATEKIA